jgi:hypothetical protein
MDETLHEVANSNSYITNNPYDSLNCSDPSLKFVHDSYDDLSNDLLDDPIVKKILPRRVINPPIRYGN